MYCRENGNATRGAVELRAEMPNEINTIQNAWNVICEFEYLVEADHSARKGKRYRAEVLAFTANLEHNLFQIQEQMIAVDCPLGPYRKLWVSVPKKRLVMALPYPDRIVQWSLYQYLNPVYDRLFIEDSYACRKGKGSHKAAARLQYWMRQVDRKPGPGWYYLKLDISKFFYRVNHAKLLKILAKRIKDPKLMKFLGSVVYHYIKKGLFLNLTQEELPRHGKHKQAYKKVCKKEAARAPAGESIEQRPTEVNERQEFGHWEGDTVYSGKGKVKTTCALFTMTERKTRNEIIIGVPNRKAETIVKAVDALERKLGARKFRLIFKSITFDNGTEFAAADMLERSCINKTIPRTKVYFCHPYSSWERGSNEHVNGMIRRKHPKGTDFSKVSKEQLAATEKWVNEYPRKIFGYKSSAIMFQQCLNELGIAM